MSRQHLILALHLWWRYTWRAFVVGFVVVLPMMIVVGAERAFLMSDGETTNAAQIAAFLVGQIAVVAGFAAVMFLLGWIVRARMFRKPVRMDGRVLHLIVVRDGKPVDPVPWGGAYGILWGVTWRSMLLDLIVQLPLRIAAGHAEWAQATLFVFGQVSTYAGFALLIAMPFGHTRIDLAEDRSAEIALADGR